MSLFFAISQITITYLILVFLKPKVKNKWNYCAICLAVSTTWITQLILGLFGYWKDYLLTAILMGESITGVMYYYRDNLSKKFFGKKVMILIIIFGTIFVYGVLKWLNG